MRCLRLSEAFRDGQIIPTGAERAEAERQRAERLAEKLRSLGVDPDQI